MANPKSLKPIHDFFAAKKWKPFPFQEQAWKSYLAGESGLLHVPTGSGKTYAAIMGPLAKMMAEPRRGLKALYLTPLRALARDLETAIQEPIQKMNWPIEVVSRTGDTTFAKKKRQLTKPPDMMLTTPESLAVMISQPDAEDYFKNLQVVILDEWHELMSSKRGSLCELSLSYLRSINPELQTWALSASIGNLEEAARVAVGRAQEPTIISGGSDRKLDLECLLPEKVDRFPWAGHLGFALKESLLEVLDPEVSTLIFTNTRSQAERWFEALLQAKPDMEEFMALHHSSLEKEEREAVEEGVKNGDLKWVVCTSSLDLGVDFQPVERVVQIGSPKMVARMIQRAGRSAHRPGGKSRLLFVPTNSWEILELEAVKKAVNEKLTEPRRPLKKPLDVLLQHMMTLACGPGLRMDELQLSLKETFSFSEITQEELNWCRRFLTLGGETLQSYPQFHKLVMDEESGKYRPADPRVEKLHRMSIGTIVSRQSVQVSYTNRTRIGSVEESFISKLKKGDVFQFAGKKLEFVLLKDMTAFVKSSKAPTNTVPSWDGGRFPISETLGQVFREVLGEKHPGLDRFLKPLLGTQSEMSVLPSSDTLLIETWQSKRGSHLFVYPFEGRSVHEGLAQLWGYRFAQRQPTTFSFSLNDYGFEMVGPEDYDFKNLFDDDFFSDHDLVEEIGQSLQIGQLSQRQFKEIAQIAGLVFVGYPGSPKTGRQMQVSASLLYEVFKKHEPGNLLIRQSFDEVLANSLESGRIRRTLQRMSKMKTEWIELESPSPLSFPLVVESIAVGNLSNESLESKIARLKKSWEKKNDHSGSSARH
ncbi:ligase-associated DNA damage response DEXH box helicase [Bdellovibrio sp. SKB1291214]|uniref:ligase-associated DNA damage response DEXH box helicase n=1 Tax=Bdellovibrio sp. SKB1291214 TaxID=1732569 RepID=UPI002240CF49|nr:ligase-associated DNA damage response DEXH box helicase [Bdellovibrio sp. SKB1291214]UYL07991.1 ligase-associated DNA damage response DEXH box helicase [Bdellovibrio sp. SKB1291214]